jgi:hypothetical protein
MSWIRLAADGLGFFFEKHKRYFGENDPDILVVQGLSKRFQSSLNFISSVTVLPASISNLNLPLFSSSRKCLRGVFSILS